MSEAAARPVRIRAMRPSDWPAVAAAYAEGIAGGDATFETAVPDHAAFDASRHPVLRLVAVAADDAVLGWAATVPVSARAVYAGVQEHSVYVARAAHGRGVGASLLAALCDLSERCGVWTLRSAVFPENTTSLRLHARAGFREVGRQQRAGFGHGRWRDTVLLERRAPIGGERPFLRLARRAETDSVVALLRQAGLPPDGLAGCPLLVVADADVTGGDLRGAAALEQHPAADGEPAYLLRSVVVHPDARGEQLGRALVGRVLGIADVLAGRQADVGLLTASAEAAGFFDALGFTAVRRDALPPALAASPQLQGLCPDSAQAWVRRGAGR